MSQEINKKDKLKKLFGSWMDAESINKKVTELLGECWHEEEVNNNPFIGEGKSGKLMSWSKRCKHCHSLSIRNKNYAEKIADAWELVEFLSENFKFSISRYNDAPFYVVSIDDMVFNSESAPLAICLAFIKVTKKKSKKSKGQPCCMGKAARDECTC